jgi:MFS family permease
MSIGSVQAVLPVYINEQSVPRIRGLFIVAYTLWFTVGNLFASVALQVHGKKDAYDYKTPIYTQYGAIGLCGLIFLFLPESPWWLISKGKVDQCRKVLEWKFRGVPGADVDRELMVMQETIAEERRMNEVYKAQGLFAIFKGLNLKRFLIGSWPKVLQQFVGMSVFSNYSTYFFQLAGNQNPFLATIYLTAVSLLSTVLDALLVDRIGRRRMTLIGFGGACSGVLLLAIIGCFDYKNATLGTVLVVACCIANFCNTFQSSTSYAYLTEMPEQRFRARATGWGLAWCNCFSVLFNFTVPLMLDKWVVKTAFLFVCTGIPGTVSGVLGRG